MERARRHRAARPPRPGRRVRRLRRCGVRRVGLRHDAGRDQRTVRHRGEPGGHRRRPGRVPVDPGPRGVARVHPDPRPARRHRRRAGLPDAPQRQRLLPRRRTRAGVDRPVLERRATGLDPGSRRGRRGRSGPTLRARRRVPRSLLREQPGGGPGRELRRLRVRSGCARRGRPTRRVLRCDAPSSTTCASMRSAAIRPRRSAVRIRAGCDPCVHRGTPANAAARLRSWDSWNRRATFDRGATRSKAWKAPGTTSRSQGTPDARRRSA